jgi:hypothetical protein
MKMSAQQLLNRTPQKNQASEVVYIAPDNMSPGLINADESILWPVNLTKSNQQYFTGSEISPFEGSESITEDGTESITWRSPEWSEEEENVS